MAWARILSLGVVALSLTVSLTSCCKPKGESVSVGGQVQAPWSAAGTMYPGRVTELYGKLAHIDFDDGDKGWALVTKLNPPGKPGADPSDRCTVQVDDRVMAPWSKTKRMYAGRVAEVYGKLAMVNFDDGDKGWALCAESKKQ